MSKRRRKGTTNKRKRPVHKAQKKTRRRRQEYARLHGYTPMQEHEVDPIERLFMDTDLWFGLQLLSRKKPRGGHNDKKQD